VTKARAFEPEELGMAFKKIDFDNRYELVRAAVASVAYFGANRMAEIKDLKVSGENFFFYRFIKITSIKISNIIINEAVCNC
jgi:hypothetical protein